jgi:TIR domain
MTPLWWQWNKLLPGFARGLSEEYVVRKPEQESAKESVLHRLSSTIGIDTIYKSGGKIPEVFLRGCGAPEEFITSMRSLIVQPVQFYKSFISYSSQDQKFADRLYSDLQNNGVRCWLATEDLKIGERLRTGLDEAILLHEKLLLILSKHSVASDRVEQD